MKAIEAYTAWNIPEELVRRAGVIEQQVKTLDVWKKVDDIREYNQLKVLKALQDAKISEAGFAGSSGYGYDDLGRERLELAFAQVMGCEKALLRIQISSGTQAIGLGLFGLLRPGDRLLSATGLPYDSLYQTIGLDAAGRMQKSPDNIGSLVDFGVSFDAVELAAGGSPDLETLAQALHSSVPPRMVFIQRSRGYSTRAALTGEQISQICRLTKELSPKSIIFVDNCYGEFTDYEEPSGWGADLMAGSLIKNPGGGLAPSGGYVCGKAMLVDKAAARLTVPGLGAEVGPSLGYNRQLTQGLYFAPHVVAQCLHGLIFTAALFEDLGVETSPGSAEQRGDIIQSLRFADAEALIAFCQGVQAASPVDAFVAPVPALLPGYAHEVIMAAGCFVQGSSIELSADGPVAPPFMAYLQGGLNYEQVKLAALLAIKNRDRKNGG